MITHSQIAEVVRDGYANRRGYDLGIEWFHTPVDNSVVVTFRGSDGWSDWLRNSLAIPYRTDRCGLGHMGFIRSAERALAKGLAKELHKTYGRHERYHLAGHSKGVESAPFAEILYSMGFNVVEWVGFGCPRMWLTREPFPFPATVYANPKDIVTKVAPWPYKHRAKVIPTETELKVPSFKEHGMETYMERL